MKMKKIKAWLKKLWNKHKENKLAKEYLKKIILEMNKLLDKIYDKLGGDDNAQS